MNDIKTSAQEILEKWLDQKYTEALVSLENDKFCDQDMIILILKEQNEYIQKLEQELKKLK